MDTPFDSSMDDEPRRRGKQHSRTPRSFPTSSDAALECRLDRSFYAAIGIWAFFGVAFQIMAFQAPKQNGIWGVTVALTAMFHVPVLLFTYWAKRVRVWANDEGLRFRGLGRTRFIAWQNVEDYGWKQISSRSKSQGTIAILFVRGQRKPQEISPSLTHGEELREFIARHATSARVNSWQVLGTRDVDEWPQVFSYHDVSGWSLVGAYLGLTLALFAVIFLPAMFGGTFISNVTMTWAGLGTLGRIAFALSPFMVGGLYPAIILTHYPGIKAARRFLDQCVIATREGLEFERGASRIFVPWGDIERFELAAMPGNLQMPVAVIHTRRARLEFHSRIQNFRLLKAIIATRATNAASSQWKYAPGADGDLLGDVRSLWRSGIEGVGARTYHYGTRTNRMFLLLLAVMGAIYLYLAVYGRIVNGIQTPPGTADKATLLTVFSLLTLGALWGGLAFWFSTVEVGEDGVTQRGVWGQRHLRWSEIKGAKFNGPFSQIKSDTTTLRIGLLAGIDDLKDEFVRRGLVQGESK